MLRQVAMDWIPSKEIRGRVVTVDRDSAGFVAQLGDDVVEPLDLARAVRQRHVLGIGGTVSEDVLKMRAPGDRAVGKHENEPG